MHTINSRYDENNVCWWINDKSRFYWWKSQRRTAVHEIGHATIRYILEKLPGIKKITINAEGTGTLGYVEYNNTNFNIHQAKWIFE